jgi:spore coat polysaccharide biosynthesis protein SpsF
MRVVAIIQARMGSTRLPGKVLMDIAGETMLARVVNRVRRATRIDETAVATTVSGKDEPIVSECRRLGVACFRGSEEDVLDRYYQTALTHKAEAVVRITSDCPLIDPEVIDTVIEAFLTHKPDYASNCLERSYPRGLDTEVMSVEALTHAWRESKKPYQRVHVTSYIYENPELFRTISIKADADYRHQRWTVDTPEDLTFVRTIYARLGSKDTFSWRDVVKTLDLEPQLGGVNRHIRQKDLEQG